MWFSSASSRTLARTLCRKARLAVEHLENRLTPATLVNPHTVTYVDTANHQVAVTIDRPVFELATINSVFQFDSGDVTDRPNNAPQRLHELNLSILNADGATLKVSVSKLAPSASGHTIINYINAGGRDLNAITGKLFVGHIDAGDSDLDTQALQLLRIEQLGVLGTGSIPSNIQGSVASLQIRDSILGVFLTIDGSVTKATVRSLLGFSSDSGGRLKVTGDLGSIKVAGAIAGHVGGNFSGVLDVGGDIGQVRVGAFVSGGDDLTGRISSGGDIGLVKIGGALFGGSGIQSGSIVALGQIGRVIIGDDLQQGNGNLSGSIRAGKDIGSVLIKGDFKGLISAVGEVNPSSPTDVAIGSVRIKGNADGGLIRAGVNTLGDPVNADAQIGSVTIGGDCSATSILAGATPGPNGLFGDADDSRFAEAAENLNIHARIGKVVIQGVVAGTADSADHFGFVAEEIGAVRIGGVPVSLIPGNDNDVIELLDGTTDDLTLREV